MSSEKLSIRPYARLLTMLGDQLIKNERIALVELIKNAYDADADSVEVRFENFNEDMSINNCSRIVVKDDGCGMTPEKIKDSWMNPADPKKYIEKEEGKRKTPEKERVIQGEKGIGRFAVFKLGKSVTITTQFEGSEFESVLKYDFMEFDDEFTSKNDEQKDIFLDEIEVDYSEVFPPSLITEPRGTIIEIRELKGQWNHDVIDKLCRDISGLTDPVSRITDREATDNFKISVFSNGEPESVEDKNAEYLKRLIEDKAVLRIQGEFDSEQNAFKFKEAKNGKTEQINLEDSKIKGLWIWKREFEERGDRYIQPTLPGLPIKQKEVSTKRSRRESSSGYQCGSFKFYFYIFDFSRGISEKYELKQSEKNMLKDYRVYLYRDNVRVYPYGDPDDDWLNIDVTRGTARAGDFFSNDQIVGWIDISQEDNPDLRDKTNREGLIEKGNAVSDFKFLIPTFLSYIKQYHYSRYQQKGKGKNVVDLARSETVSKGLSGLKDGLRKKGDETSVREVGKIEKDYEREKNYLVQRAEITEDLAGVGLSVEMTSHDIMLMIARADDIGKRLSRLSRNSGDTEIRKESDMLVGVLAQITDSMRDVQSLFKSAKRRKKALRIEPVLDKIFQIYKSLLEKKDVRYRKIILSGSPLVADTNEGVVMQVLINLFDNASYWLGTVDHEGKEILVTLNGPQGELVFSDNGPGIDKEDLPYIFEAFYSGKGQEGRGLGLYIARQLLQRHDYTISVAEDRQKKLPGANFVVSLIKEDSQ